jgi:hypothetical protein
MLKKLFEPRFIELARANTNLQNARRMRVAGTTDWQVVLTTDRVRQAGTLLVEAIVAPKKDAS